MFPSSTQRRFWMYDNPDELEHLRQKANKSAGKALIKSGKATQDKLLSPKEELFLVRSYLENNLRKFCKMFKPPMRRDVMATAFIYMKRFYLNESCMAYHPRDIGITCAYLACKVDEFNVSISEFIKNVHGNCKLAQKTVLSNELLLMRKLKFHLTVHLPFRAVEGFLIDIRARCPKLKGKVELLSPEVENFLEKSMFTDACFLFTPSQIALAALYSSAEKLGIKIGPYVEEILLNGDDEVVKEFRATCQEVQQLIENDTQNIPSKDVIKKLDEKLLEVKSD